MEEEKDGEHRVAGRERIILCLLYFNSEKQTQYYDTCGFDVVVVAVFYTEHHYAAYSVFFHFFLLLLLFSQFCWCCIFVASPLPI